MADPSTPSAEHLIHAAREALAGRPSDIRSGALSEELWALDKWSCAERLADVLNGGADINAPWDDSGRNPRTSLAYPDNDESLLLNAVSEDWPETCIALLLAAGAKVGAIRDDGLNSLTLAAWKRQLSLVELMLLADIPVDACSAAGQTALMMAAQRGDMRLARLLIGSGAKIQATDDEGNSVLHYAAKGGSLDTVRYLIEQGSDCRETNDAGRLPEDVAASEVVRAYLIAEREKIELERCITNPGELSDACRSV